MFDSKINVNNGMEHAETDLELELKFYKNDGSLRFPERHESMTLCTSHKIVLNIVRCSLVASIAMMYVSWR